MIEYPRLTYPNQVALKSKGDKWYLNSKMVAIDAGNDKNSASMAIEGTLYTVNFPQARARVTGKRVKNIDMQQTQMTYVDWQGTRFAVGDNVWDLGSEYPLEEFVNSVLRYGSEHHVFNIITSLALLGVPTDTPLTILVSVPPGLIDNTVEQVDTKGAEITANTAAERTQAALLAGEGGKGDGRWTISVNGGEPLCFHIKNVVTVFEGLGGYFAYRSDLNGNLIPLMNNEAAKPYDYLTGLVTIVDIGYGTLDRFAINNGKIVAESLPRATNPEGGIYTWIVKPLLDQILERTQATHIKAAHVSAWLREWVREWDGAKLKRRIGKFDLDLHPTAVALQRRFADFTIQSALEPAWNSGSNTIGEVGGGWLFIEPLVKQAYPGRDILTPKMFPHLEYTPLYALNDLGGLCFLANNRRVHGKPAK